VRSASIEYTVVSVGAIRLLAGSELGFGRASIADTVVYVVFPRMIEPASGSVPVFTDHRSTPHEAEGEAVGPGVGVGDAPGA
jgi:hypothetical protein